MGSSHVTSHEANSAAAHGGVVCGLLDGIAALARCGVDTTGRLHLIGGGARPRACQQMTASLDAVEAPS